MNAKRYVGVVVKNGNKFLICKKKEYIQAPKNFSNKTKNQFNSPHYNKPSEKFHKNQNTDATSALAIALAKAKLQK